MNEMSYIVGVDRVIRVRVVWRELREPGGGELAWGRDIGQGMGYAAKWWDGDDHILWIYVGCKRKVVGAGRYRAPGGREEAESGWRSGPRDTSRRLCGGCRSMHRQRREMGKELDDDRPL